MDPSEWAEALAQESERVERKESHRDAPEILHAACALANDLGETGRPGYLTLGIQNDGAIVGVDTSDGSLQRLVNRLASTKILPNPSISVETRTSGGRGIIVVRIAPYPVPPVVKVDGVAWVRVGTTTRRASDADLARLQERRPENRLPFDQRSVAGARIDDLNRLMLRDDYLADRESNSNVDTYPSFESWLCQREIVRRTSKEGWLPTAAGLLTFGVDPQRFLPGASIEFARYGGVDFDAPVISRKSISGPLPAQLDALWAQLQAHIAEVPAAAQGIRSAYDPEYPLEALKELGRNLVQHRTYEGTHAPGRVSWLDDRVVFTNPGSRFGAASEGDFGDHSDYRNPTITRFLVQLGYVERLGRGIRRVRSLLSRSSNPPLEAETDGFTTVTVRRRP